MNLKLGYTFTSMALAVTLLALSSPVLAQASIQDLGDLRFIAYSKPSSISADGSVVVGWSFSASGQEAFRWTQGGGMVGLGDLPGGKYKSSASAVSADGLVVVGWSNSPSGREAFRWTREDGMVGLGDLPGGMFKSSATDVSADGSAVVGRSSPTHGGEAFLWTPAGGMRNLTDVLEGDFGLDLTGVTLKNAYGIDGLDFTGWRLKSANGISADGVTIVGFAKNRFEGWIARVPIE